MLTIDRYSDHSANQMTIAITGGATSGTPATTTRLNPSPAHATARRSRGRADEYVAVGRGVRIQAEHRSRDEPAQVHAPAHHIAADAVGFLRLEAPRRPGAALADDVAK